MAYRSIAYPTMNLYCPGCGQTDAVQKVSSIVSAGTTTAQQFGVAPNLAGNGFYVIGARETSASNLARRLSPFPSRPGGVGIRIALVLVVLFLGGLMAGGLSLFVGTPEFGRFACGNWVLGILFTAFMISFLQLRSIARIRSRQETYDEAMRQAYARWRQLYYCARDDVVFSPEERVAVPVEYLGSYLYD